MSRLSSSLLALGRAVVRRGGSIVVAALLASLVGVGLARHLGIDTDFANLLPQDRPSVRALEKVRQTIGGEAGVSVGIVSPSFEANRRFAKALIPEAMALKTGSTSSGPEEGTPYFRRVEYERETAFLEKNALYFASDRELRQVETFLEETIKEAKQEANPFYADFDAGPRTDSLAEVLDRTYERLVGPQYPMSDDSTTMALQLFPSSTNTNVEFVDGLYRQLRALVDRLNPQSYHPEMEVVLAGRLYRQLVEIRGVQNDVTNSFGAGATAVLLVVVAYFLYKLYRARCGSGWRRRCFVTQLKHVPLLALVIGAPLLMSLTWTGGFAYLAFRDLNLITSTLGLVLFGLGIDYGIHFYGRYAEKRADGVAVDDAVAATLASTGQAIAIGAFTTAGALYVLTAADFKGFSEFGTIAGTGVLFALVAMTIVMPALIAVLERWGFLNFRDEGAAARFSEGRREGEAADWRMAAARPVVLGGLLAVVVALGLAPRVDFQYDFTTLSPDYQKHERRAQIVDRALRGRDDERLPAYIVAESPRAVPEIVEAVRKRMRRDTTGLIRRVESLPERFPLADSAKQARVKRIADVRRTITGSKYLMEDGEPRNEEIGRLLRAAQTQAPISIDQVPGHLRATFTTKDGEVGTFALIYPSRSLADGRDGIRFKRFVGTITTDRGNTYHAGSTAIVAADMLVLMRREAPWMIGATFLIVALLMLANFRSLRWAGLALVPLVVGLLWMLLVMEVFGLMVNFYNMIVFPAILGIGNDAGVHMTHRYREEGPRSLRTVLRSTGEHVTMGTLTTMVGFGGLLLSFHPGLNSIGVLAVVGLGTTLLAAVIFLPALLQWLEDRGATPADSIKEEDAE